jgi:hypothetical protein
MGNTNISVGDDTPSGEPGNAPEGPYITDEDDGSRLRKDKPSDKDQSRTEPNLKGPAKRPPGAVKTDF